MCTLVGVKRRREPVFKPVGDFVTHRGVGGNFLESRPCLKCSSGFLVFTDQQLAVGEVHVRWHFEVVRSGFVLVNAPCHVKRRAVAWAQEPALPVVRQRWLRARLELVRGRASQMGANAYGNKVLRLDRAPFIARIFRCEFSPACAWIRDQPAAPVTCDSAANCSGVRRTTHTGLPRHSTVTFSPGLIAPMSTSTAAPAALARSDGLKVLTKGDCYSASANDASASWRQ